MRRLVVAVGLVTVGGGCSGPAEDSPGALYRHRCARCHGSDLEGTPTAPSLQDLKRHWNPDTLARYLGDPEVVRRGDARLEAQSARYLIDMPAYDELSAGEMNGLVEFLLSQDGAR